jgi:hypothetical protein
MVLTAKQRALRDEIDKIVSLVGLNFTEIDAYAPAARTPVLQVMKQHIIRGEIIMKYTLLDELLTVIICNYYFRRSARRQTFQRLWRTQRFRIFNHYIMDEMYVLGKMHAVHAMGAVPGNIQSIICRINELRNAVAHSFFPENRRKYIKSKAVLYDGIDIFSRDGVERFKNDSETANDYLTNRAFGA